ncbi:hypothetical protein HQN64_23180 [Enterobacteriaceae bacterium BIT-l23]|uniref:winged helix-turn-helix domain-containing protein n=1 Tax=Jejubacter sp. L23 TaxID=3092086 RepID=UPI0015859202|nr:hypothetical protein [Enterobacteriaceae bacterium BIT-l23]
MGRELIGYYIGNNVQLEIAHRKISNFDSKSRPGNSFILRETMMRLFLYLLEYGNEKIATNEQILYHVWDLHGLKSSNQRLWQVIQALKLRLVALGVQHDFIMRIETFGVKGYTLKSELIRPFYFYHDNCSQIER